MKRNAVRVFAAVMAAVLMLSALCLGAMAATSISPIITSYTSSESTIKKNSGATIEVTVKDTEIKAADVNVSDIDVNHLIDSFSGGLVTVEEIPGYTGEQLSYIVKFTGVMYSGVGQSLKFMVGYADTYTELSLTVSETVPYVEPTPEPDDPYTPEALPEPTVLIHRGDMAKPIEAGQEFDVSISFENLSNLNLSNAVVTYSPSDPIILAGGSSSFVLDKIGRKETASTVVRLKALESISSSNLTLGVSLKYTYYNNISTVTGTVSDTVNIPAKVTNGSTVTVPEPPVLITRSPLQPISAGQTFEVEIAFKNAGETALVSPVATFSTSGELILQNETSTMVLPEIPAGEGYSVKLQIKAASEISSTTQSISADLKFYYKNGSGLTQSSASETIKLSANVTQKTDDTKTDSPVPNVIISDFGFGGDSVAAGEPFELSFTFKNTGKLKIENIVVVVDGGESFTMNGSTNTFYYDALGAGSELTQTVPMQTLAAAKSGAQTVNISFRYEYVDGTRRASSSSDIKLSVPVYQQDRLQIDEPKLYDMAYAGMETTIVMSYVNKGKSDMSNVEVSIGGEVDALQQTQYLGNFTSGQSGNMSFVVTPRMAGQTEIVITVTYEDANLQTVKREFPMTLDVQEMNWGGGDEPFFPEEPVEEEKDGGLGFWLWVIIGAAVVVVVIIIVVIVKKGKKKKAALASESEWDDWDDAKENVTAGSGKEE